MSAALRALLDDIIDYAGLFPPAKLPVDEAVAQYLKHLRGSESWLVSRFACSAGSLGALADQIAATEVKEQEVPIAITVIGARTAEPAEFAKSVQRDLDQMQEFIERASDTAEIEAYEVRKPVGLATKDAIRVLKPLGVIDVFLELGWDDDQPAALADIVEQEWLGAKARTGGLTPPEFPSCQDLAGFIHDCMSLDLRFKLTAGMHHPLRHLDPLLGARQHGFLNVAVAAALIEEHDFSRAQVAEVLADENPSHFVFGVDSFAYRDWEVQLPAIEDMRSLYLSYGCCSVEDPILGLATLGLVEVGR